MASGKVTITLWLVVTTRQLPSVRGMNIVNCTFATRPISTAPIFSEIVKAVAYAATSAPMEIIAVVIAGGKPDTAVNTTMPPVAATEKPAGAETETERAYPAGILTVPIVAVVGRTTLLTPLMKLSDGRETFSVIIKEVA